MNHEDLKEKIEAIIPMIRAFFEARGFEGIEESIDSLTGLPKISTLASDYDYQMSLTPKLYMNSAEECELLFLKPSVGDTYYRQRSSTLTLKGGSWKFEYDGREYVLTPQVLEAIYDAE